jgi:hypothetical protein
MIFFPTSLLQQHQQAVHLHQHNSKIKALISWMILILGVLIAEPTETLVIFLVPSHKRQLLSLQPQ